MKKTYFSPVAKTIDLYTQDGLLLTVSGVDDGGGDWGNSNRRERPSNSIWGEDDYRNK